MIKKFLTFVFLFGILCGLYSFEYQNYLQVNSEKYPNADTVLLFDYDHISYEPDGSNINTDDYYLKVITDKGVEESRIIPVYFNTFYTDITVEAFEIIKSDGRVVKIDLAKNSETVIDSSQISQNIYDPANKILKLSVPDLVVNDIIHLRIKENNRLSRIKNVFSFIKVLQSNMPIINYELIIEGSENFPLKKILVKDEVKGSINFSETKSDGKIIYKWIVRDVPMQIPEEDSPPMYLFSQRILGSTAENWEEISRWYYNLCLPHLQKITPEMKKKVAELTSDCKGDIEKIQAIFQFVSQEIRYMGLTTETEAPGYEPHDVDITFNNRYGVCRDKAALLVAMLQIAGFESYPVLFYAGYPKDSEVANNYFNHAITAVKLNGKYILMDSTDETTKELLPAYLANNSYLVAHPEGESLLLSDSVPSSANCLNIVNNGIYKSSDNSLEIKSTLTFEGINDIIYRNALSRWTKGYEMQYFSMILRKINPGIILKSVELKPENIRDMSKKLEIVLNYEAKNYFDVASGKLDVLPEISLGEYIGAANMLLGNMSLDERKFPMELFSTAETIEKTHIDFKDFSISNVKVPNYQNLNNELLEFEKNIIVNGNKLDINSKFALKKNLIYPNEYKMIKDNLRVLEVNDEKLILFQGQLSVPEFDTRIIKDITEYDFIDDYNWSQISEREFEVLNYASMKDNSELKVYYNPVWEKVELLEGYVKNGDVIQKISPSEINIMDQNINAPAYSTGKIFTVNFPNVKVGSQVYYKVKKTATNHPYFASRHVFGSYDYIEKKVVIFNNVSKNFKYLPDVLPEEIKLEESGKRLVFSVENLKVSTPEIASPPSYVAFPTIWVSNGDIEEFSEKVNQLIRKQAKVTDKVKKITAELIADKKTESEKIQAIRDYVAKNIRRVDINFSDYPMIFSLPDEVLERGYATSADSAVLLLAMLKSGKLDKNCDIILLSGLKEIGDCDNYWFDILTNDFTKVLLYRPVDLLAMKQPTQTGFVLNNSSQYGLLYEVPAENYTYLNTDAGKIEVFDLFFRNNKLKHFNLTISEDNSADIEAIYGFGGVYFDVVNKMYQTATPEERNRFMKDLESNISLRGVSKKRDFVADWEKGIVKILLNIHIDNFVLQSGEYYYFELPEFITINDFIRLGSEDRAGDYLLKQVNSHENFYQIHLPRDSRLINSAENIYENSALMNLEYRCKYEYLRDKKILQIENTFYALEACLDSDVYRKLLNLNKLSDKKIQKIVIFTKNFGKNLQ